MDYNLPGSSVHGIIPGKNTGVGCHFLLQGIFPTQGWNPHLLHWQVGSLPLNHQGSRKNRPHDCSWATKRPSTWARGLLIENVPGKILAWAETFQGHTLLLLLSPLQVLWTSFVLCWVTATRNLVHTELTTPYGARGEHGRWRLHTDFGEPLGHGAVDLIQNENDHQVDDDCCGRHRHPDIGACGLVERQSSCSSDAIDNDPKDDGESQGDLLGKTGRVTGQWTAVAYLQLDPVPCWAALTWGTTRHCQPQKLMQIPTRGHFPGDSVSPFF